VREAWALNGAPNWIEEREAVLARFNGIDAEDPSR
jgi:hypothetical protein